MTDWKNILIPVISVVLSSSIIGTILNSTYQDFAKSINRPAFNFDGILEKNYTNRTIDLSMFITNNGKEDAQNPKITFKLSDNYKLIGKPKVECCLQDKIMIDANDTSTFYYNLDNETINQGESIYIQAKLNDTRPIPIYIPSYYYDDAFDYLAYITVRYDNGFASFPEEDKNKELIGYLFIILPFIIVSLSIIIPFVSFRKLYKYDNHKNYNEFRIKTADLLFNIYDSIRNHKSSKKIFNFKFWDDEYFEIKSKIFESYIDYNLLNKLYTLLKDREFLCLKDNVDDTVLTDSNINCLKITTDAINHINWNTFLSNSIARKLFQSNFLRHCLFALLIASVDIGLLLILTVFNSFSIFEGYLWLVLVSEIGMVGIIRILLFYRLSAPSLFNVLPIIKNYKKKFGIKKLDLFIIIIIVLPIGITTDILHFLPLYQSMSLSEVAERNDFSDTFKVNFILYFFWILFIEIIRFNLAIYLFSKKLKFLKISLH